MVLVVAARGGAGGPDYPNSSPHIVFGPRWLSSSDPDHAAAGCWEPRHAAAFTLIIKVSAVLALWALLGISLEHSTLKIENMCFYILKLLGRISFIVVNIVGKLLIKIPEWWWQVLYNNGNNGSRRWLHFTAASLKYFLIFLQIFLFVLWDSRS